MAHLVHAHALARALALRVPCVEDSVPPGCVLMKCVHRFGAWPWGAGLRRDMSTLPFASDPMKVGSKTSPFVESARDIHLR